MTILYNNFMNIKHYTYRVTWSPDDGEFVAACAEFPSLSWLAGSQTDALVGLQTMLREIIADMEAAGELVPAPFSSRKYSGKFVVRTPENIHRRISVEAAEAGVSLNRYVNAKLVS